MRGSARCGFTLVEVLVALSVSGIALAAGFGALATLQDRSEQAREATTQAIEGSSARSMVVEWLEGARETAPALDERFEGHDAGAEAIPSDELYVPTTAVTPADVPVTLVRLHLDTDPATPERGFVAEFYGRLGAQPQRLEIAPEVTGIEIRYLPDIDGDVEWATSWIGFDALPRAVEIRLRAEPDRPLPPLLQIPIRVALATER